MALQLFVAGLTIAALVMLYQGITRDDDGYVASSLTVIGWVLVGLVVRKEAS